MNKNDLFRLGKKLKDLPKIGIFLTENDTIIAKLNSFDFFKWSLEVKHVFCLRNYFLNVFMKKKLGEN